jgi:hypothetical protein
MGRWPGEECRDNRCGIQQQPLGFGLQFGSPPHDAVSIRAKPERPRDAAHFFRRRALLVCQSAEISLGHEANSSAEGLKLPTVCNSPGLDLGRLLSHEPARFQRSRPGLSRPRGLARRIREILDGSD